MTTNEYKTFISELEKNGYKKWNIPKSIQNEDFYFYKSFAKDDNGISGYQVLFLVWDIRKYPGNGGHDFGVSPNIITESGKGSRIDLTITDENISLKSIEKFAADFYFKFILTHEL